jgi:hypothetical protein
LSRSFAAAGSAQIRQEARDALTTSLGLMLVEVTERTDAASSSNIHFARIFDVFFACCP